MKLTEVLKSVALQSGVTETEIQTILENASIGSIEVDDAISTRLTAQRLTIESAKQNPDLKKHFTAQALNGVDAVVLRQMEDFGFDDATKTEIGSQDTTFKKVEFLAKKIKEIESKKATNPADVEKLNNQLTDLNNELKISKESLSTREKELTSGFETERIDWEVNSILGSFNYALPKDTPADAVKAFARTIANKGLQEKGLKIVKENGALVLKTSEGTDYFDNNVKVGLNDFVQKTLANAKVLSASQTTTPTQTTPAQTHNATPETNTSEFMKAFDEVMAPPKINS